MASANTPPLKNPRRYWHCQARSVSKFGDQSVLFEIKRDHSDKVAFLSESWNLGATIAAHSLPSSAPPRHNLLAAQHGPALPPRSARQPFLAARTHTYTHARTCAHAHTTLRYIWRGRGPDAKSTCGCRR